MLKAFRGDLIESDSISLHQSHPGPSFRLTIPAAGGEAQSRFYLVGTRLYQILVLGPPDFVAAEQATSVIESFRLLP